MKVRLKDELMVITAETDEERRLVATWAARVDGHVFVLKRQEQDADTFRLQDLGPRDEACREPINVTSRHPDAPIRLISNFAHSPFQLDGRDYASIEAFWQGLKFPDDERRRQIARLHGEEARLAGADAAKSDTFQYSGQTIRVGTSAHWRLVSQACWAKFTQHAAAKAALLNTGERLLMHKTRGDSPALPGVVLADLWMNIRRKLRAFGV